MLRRANSWFLILLVGVIAVLAMPHSAAAQGISMAQYNPVVRENDTSTSTSTTDSTIKLTITHDDCRNNKLKFKFSVAVPGYQQNYEVEAWAGRSSSNCVNEFSSSDSLKTCWKLGNLSVTNAVATAEFTAAQLLGIGASSGKRILTSSCDDPVDGKGRQSFTITFMFTANSGVPASTTQPMYYSLVGPDAPTLNDALASDQSLQLQWGTLSGVTTEVTYEFFCVKNQAKSGCKSTVLESFGSTYGTDSSSGGTGGTSSDSSSAGGSTSTASTGAGGTSATTTTETVANASSALEDGSAGSAGTAGDGGAAGAAGNWGAYFGAAGAASIASAGTVGFTSGGTQASTGQSGAATTVSDSSAGASTASTTVADEITPMEPGSLSDWRCGSKTGRLSSNGYTDPKVMALENDESYAVALAVRDTYGNLGSLSNYVCQTPVEIETFFERYRSAGGKGGGGFCNLDIHPRRSTLPALLGALGLTAWLRNRKRPYSRRPATRGKNS
ncbi:MAG TPA: hypothetical protein VIV60_31775 [Polyangiaceae bacterium]